MFDSLSLPFHEPGLKIADWRRLLVREQTWCGVSLQSVEAAESSAQSAAGGGARAAATRLTSAAAAAAAAPQPHSAPAARTTSGDVDELGSRDTHDTSLQPHHLILASQYQDCRISQY